MYDRLESKKIQIVDATCPFVKKIHNIVQKHSEMGENIITVSDTHRIQTGSADKSRCYSSRYIERIVSGIIRTDLVRL